VRRRYDTAGDVGQRKRMDDGHHAGAYMPAGE